MLPTLFLVCLLAGTAAFAQDSYVDESLTDDKIEALGDLIDSVVQFAYTTNVSSLDTATRTAVGYLVMDDNSTVTFQNTEARATSTGLDIFHFPEIGLDFTTYINPLPSSVSVTPYNRKRDVAPTPTAAPTRVNRKEKRELVDKRGQTPIDICPVPKTVTVIEWIDCAASPSMAHCDICPVTQLCKSCDNGWQWILPTSTQNTPCPTTTQACSSCKGGYEIILLGTPGPLDPPCTKVICDSCQDGYKYIVLASEPSKCPTSTQVCPTCPGGYQVILIGTPGPLDPPTTKIPCKECEGGYKYVIENNININVNLGGAPVTVTTGNGGSLPPASSPTPPTNTYTPNILDENITVGYGEGFTGSPTMTIGPRDIQVDYAFLATIVISFNSKLLFSSKYPLLADWSSQLTWDATATPTPTDTTDEFDDEYYDEEIGSILASLDPMQSYPTECNFPRN
jgi:hypothetical protein